MEVDMFKSDKKRQIARNRGKIEFLALRPDIQALFEQGFDALKVHVILLEQNKLTMSYRTFARYFRQFKMKTQPKTASQVPKPLSPPPSASERKAPWSRFQLDHMTKEEIEKMF
jgi:hypothetical protein